VAATRPRERDRIRLRGRTGPNARQGASAGCLWLAPAVEMAARISGDWPLGGDNAALRWTSFPESGVPAPGMQASRLHAARSFTIRTLCRWGLPERSDDVALVVSELLTNALRHGRPVSGRPDAGWPVQLGLFQSGPGVMCAVADPSSAAPVPRNPGAAAETGRGLRIIAALSDQWGYLTSGDQGKITWALFWSRMIPPAAGPT
jgi:hypothetical protein